MPTYRNLTSLDDFRTVMALEREIWGMTDEELVPSSLLLVSVKCGAVVIGAFDGDRMVGFVQSFPGDRHGHRLHWSHMLGVVDGYRDGGIGRMLKLLQRARVLEQGTDLIEWTYDPLQAPNAHFNFGRLGVVVREYLEDAYGTTSSPLHGDEPTDRFVAQWWLRSAAVLVRAQAEGWPAPSGHRAATHGEVPRVWMRRQAPDAPVVNPMRREGSWWACESPRVVPPDAAALRVSVPPAFTAMLRDAPDLAHDWRTSTRRAFQLALSQRFLVVDFERDATGGGHYVLTREPGRCP